MQVYIPESLLSFSLFWDDEATLTKQQIVRLQDTGSHARPERQTPAAPNDNVSVRNSNEDALEWGGRRGGECSCPAGCLKENINCQGSGH